jgi:hypothetical protein
LQAARRAKLAQRGQGVVVAGVHGEQVRAVVKGDRKSALDICAQGFDLWRQPCLGLALGPQEFGAKFGQARGLALVPTHQAVAQLQFPALEFAPGVAVRQAELPRRARDGAAGLHRVQQAQKGVVQRGLAAARGADLVAEFYFFHGYLPMHGAS